MSSATFRIWRGNAEHVSNDRLSRYRQQDWPPESMQSLQFPVDPQIVIPLFRENDPRIENRRILRESRLRRQFESIREKLLQGRHDVRVFNMSVRHFRFTDGMHD